MLQLGAQLAQRGRRSGAGSGAGAAFSDRLRDERFRSILSVGNSDAGDEDILEKPRRLALHSTLDSGGLEGIHRPSWRSS